MKRFFFITTLFIIALLSSATDGNKAMAQNMALELAYDAYNKTGGSYSIWKPCDVCGTFFGGPSVEEADRAIKNHKAIAHSNLSGGDSCKITWNSESLYDYEWDEEENYLYVVHVSDVAYVMKYDLGLCDNRWFIDEYDAYNRNGYIGKGTDVVTIQEMETFIRCRFKMSNLNLGEAMRQHKKMLLFVKPPEKQAKMEYLGWRMCLYFDIKTYVTDGVAFMPQDLLVFDGGLLY